MISRQRFASTMLSMSLSLKMYGRELSKELQDIYWRALADVSDEDFERAAAILIRRGADFPVPAELLAALSPIDVPLLAAEAFKAARKLSRGRGSELNDRELRELIRTELGAAAERAFILAGEGPAFRGAWAWDDERWVRKSFLEGFTETARLEPRLALPELSEPDLTPPAVKALTSGIGNRIAS